MNPAKEAREVNRTRSARRFEAECTNLRPLGEAFILRRFAGQLDLADAQDAVSDVIIRLHRKAAEGNPPRNLRAAFFTSCQNAAIDQLRARAVRPTAPLEAAANEPADTPSPSELAERRELAADVQRALGECLPQYREALMLRFGVGLTVPEIARHRGISLDSAKKLVQRGSRQVKQQLLQLGVEHDLHQVGTGALLSGGVGEQLRGHGRIAGHASSWACGAGDAAHSGAEKLRAASFKLANAIHGTEAGTAGAISGTPQKIAAICATGATAATCLTTGVVGPGVGAAADPAVGQERPPVVQTQTDPQPDPAPVDAANDVAMPAPTPAQQIQTELGFERAAPAATPSSEFGGAAPSSRSSGGSSGGGGFGFEK
jgi:RNA polymerase sigma-70 factor (ECF subfamily)